MRLQTAIEGFWLARRRDFSPNTVQDYSLTFRRLMAFCGEVQIEKIRTKDIHAFLNYLDEDLALSGKTLSNAWTALSSLWTWAEMELSIQHVIRGKVKRPGFRRKKPKPFTEQEVRLLLSACEHMQAWISPRGKRIQADRPTAYRDRAIMLVMLDTGIRVSELCDLLVADYDQRSGALHVAHGKGDKSRTLYIAQTGQQAMWRYLAQREEPARDAPLFVTTADTKLDRNAVLHMVRRAGERVGVSGAHPHRFRHTFAIEFLRNGGNPLELQRLLGHEQMSTIQIYVELAEVDLRNAQHRASPADNWKI